MNLRAFPNYTTVSSSVRGILRSVSANRLQVDVLADFGQAGVLLMGWHPDGGELVLEVEGRKTNSWRFPRLDVQDALGLQAEKRLGCVAWFPAHASKLESALEVRYQVAGRRPRSTFVMPQAGTTQDVNGIAWAFASGESTQAEVNYHLSEFLRLSIPQKRNTLVPQRIMSSDEFILRYFDARYYAARYPDIANGEVDLLNHWLRFGRSEGRSPHPLFDPHDYSSHSSISIDMALDHYLAVGWTEGRSPSRWVEPGVAHAKSQVLGPILVTLAQDLAEGNHVQTGIIDTKILEGWDGETALFTPQKILSDYVLRGWGIQIGDGWRGIGHANYMDPREWESATNLVKPKVVQGLPVTIVLPVHSVAPAMERCLNQVRSTVSAHHQVVIVLDGLQSSQWTLLTDIVRDSPNWQVIERSEAGGFGDAVNVGVLAAKPGNDVVLLNSDAIVFDGWLERLIAHGEKNLRAASVTALTNHGSLVSYPVPSRPSSLLPGSTPAEIAQAACEANDGVARHLPTAIGHCVWIRRRAWNEVGSLNSELFPEGYGEENDWSARAEALGWVHLAAMDTFVWHEGNASFGLARKDRLTQLGISTLEAKFPGLMRSYGERGEEFKIASVMDYAAIDALRIRRSLSDIGGVGRVVICHDMGGGIDTFIKTERPLEPQRDILLILSTQSASFQIMWPHMPVPTLAGEMHDVPVECLARILAMLAPETVEVHTTAAFDPMAVTEQLSQMTSPLVLFLHDYLLACPRINLLGGAAATVNSVFCGPCTNTEDCRTCVGKWGSRWPESEDVGRWRDAGLRLVQVARAVWCPSEESSGILRQLGIAAIPWNHGLRSQADNHKRSQKHEESLSTIVGSRKISDLIARNVESGFSPQNVDVLVVGHIGEHKGARLVAHVSKLNRLVGSPLSLGLLGTFDESFGAVSSVFRYSFGRYEADQLREWSPGPSLVLLPSVFPETHHYALDDAARVAPSSTAVIVDRVGATLRRAKEFFPRVVLTPSHEPQLLFQMLVDEVHRSVLSRSGDITEGEAP